MPEYNRLVTLTDEAIIHKIYYLREQKIMLDRDLAELYGVETKMLKQAVRRNIIRFPEDFMFEMTKEELESWRSHFVASNSADTKGLRHPPFCFTEQGVTMLSCILNSERAIAVNIQIIRIFVRLRAMVSTQKDILLKLEQLERKVIAHDQDISIIFKALKQLLSPPQKPRKRIGFRRSNEQEG